MNKVVGLVVLGLLGCGGEEVASTGPTPEPMAAAPAPAAAQVPPTSTISMYSPRQADGTYDFYIGPGVQEALEQGQPLPAGWYKLGKVKQWRVDKARSSSRQEKVATFSLEDPDSSDMDVVFSARDGNHLVLKAGDPCITGVVQIFINPKTDSPVPMFDVGQWIRYPNGPTVKNTWGTGVIGDDPWPMLKHIATVPPDCK